MRIVDFHLLKAISPVGRLVMNPLSGVCFTLLAIASWFIRDEVHTQKQANFARIIAAIAAVPALIKLISVIFNLQLKIDLLLFEEQLYLPEYDKTVHTITNYNTMGPNTALSIGLLSLSIFLIDLKSIKVYRSSELIKYLLIFLGLVAIYGYAYEVTNIFVELGKRWQFVPMSFESGLVVFLMASALLFLRPHKGSMTAVIGQNPTEVFLMRFLALVIPLIVGFIKVKTQKFNLLSEGEGTAIFATVSFVISIFLLGWKSKIQYSLQKSNYLKFEKINHERRKIKRILSQSPSYINIVDIKNDKLVYGNEAEKHLVRWQHKVMVGQPFSEVLDVYFVEEDKKMILENLDKMKKMSEKDSMELEFRLKGEDDKIHWLIAKIVPYELQNGETTKVLFNAVDRTEEKEKELKLEKKKEKLEKNKEELSKARNKLKDFNQDLENKVSKKMENILEKEKRYHTYFRLSFFGIVRYEFRGIEGIDTELSIEKQVEIFDKHMFVADVNDAFLKIHGITRKDEVVGKSLKEYMPMSDEDRIKFITRFIESDYRITNEYTTQFYKKDETIKMKGNLIGVLIGKMLKTSWAIQTER